MGMVCVAPRLRLLRPRFSYEVPSSVAPVREIQCCGFKATAVVKPD